MAPAGRAANTGKRFGKGKRALRPEEVEQALELKARGLRNAQVVRLTGLNPRTVKRLVEGEESLAATIERLGKEALRNDPKLRRWAGEMQAMAVVQRAEEAGSLAEMGRKGQTFMLSVRLPRSIQGDLTRTARDLGISPEEAVCKAVGFWLVEGFANDGEE